MSSDEPECGMCAYFDVLVQTRPGPGVIQVIADHIRLEHEPAG